MTSLDKLFGDLNRAGVGLHRRETESLVSDKFSPRAHGRLGEWRGILEQLPDIAVDRVLLDGAAVGATSSGVDADTVAQLRGLLKQLAPWRKGPFDLFGIDIDAEWRSDLKWRRLENAITPLAGRNVLDVGCGNGYYAFRMCSQAPRFVLGIDPTLGHLMQFHAMQRYLKQTSLHLLPLRLGELALSSGAFDTTFSMGVLYHQRDPLQHLAQLRRTLLAGGELVLETLIAPGDEPGSLVPDGRYARMRNVWSLPTIVELQRWLADTGFDACHIADISTTTVQEQRSTEWMPFESLAEALDAEEPSLTIEGLPRPTRALVIATKA